ncbi:hypothetical protein FE257_011099 [Aspergillus nanangensis]|uniref:Uncharacterized protein n=1 Tax=Aspergillus nanangensis TaxID=2582783 RepID=A0AAD4GRM8_ASPNN|nr:hypothetical protein FE257_011099 [Aspergillus nanangensis]
MTKSVDKVNVAGDSRVQRRSATVNQKTYGYLLAEPVGSYSHTVFLIHGFPDLSMAWRYQIPLFLKLGFRVVCPDCIGYGRSDSPTTSIGPYTWKSQCEDFHELAAQLGCENIILGGHDLGAMLAYRFALYFPQFVTHLVTFVVPYLPPLPEYTMPKDLVRQWPSFGYQIQWGSEDGVVESKTLDRKGIRQFLNALYGGSTSDGKYAFDATIGVDFDMLPHLSPTKLLDDEELNFYAEEYARREYSGVVITDSEKNASASYSQILYDVIETQKALQHSLAAEAFDESGILYEERMRICLLVSGGYEYIVATLAVLSIGGSVVPLAPSLIPKEAHYLMQECNSSAILTDQDNLDLAKLIQEYTNQVSCLPIRVTPVKAYQKQNLWEISECLIDRQLELSPSREGLIIFTSGSLGPPKGVVLPRFCFSTSLPKSNEREIYSGHCAVHWIGAAIPLMKMLLAGNNIEVMRNVSPEVWWQQIRLCRITSCIIATPAPQGLMAYFRKNISRLPDKIRNQYIQGIQHIRALMIAGGMPSSAAIAFWTELSGKSPFILYGSSETAGAITLSQPSSPSKATIGRPLADVEIKLSEGDKGEILVKGPQVMISYLNNESATKLAFDKDGFFRTGDLAHLDGGEFIFDGRASSDFIKVYGSHRVPTLAVENGLMSLSYVSAAYVVSVWDYKDQQNVAAALVCAPDGVCTQSISLAKVREDLSTSLPAYMLPALLRVINHQAQLPTTRNGKILKRDLCTIFFLDDSNNLRQEVESWDKAKVTSTEREVWDWGGVQPVWKSW